MGLRPAGAGTRAGSLGGSGMSHRDVMKLAKELEEAQAAQQKRRLAWKIARVAHPFVLDLTAMEAYCDATDAVFEAQARYDEAVIDAQLEWYRSELAGEAS